MSSKVAHNGNYEISTLLNKIWPQTTEILIQKLSKSELNDKFQHQNVSHFKSDFIEWCIDFFTTFVRHRSNWKSKVIWTLLWVHSFMATILKEFMEWDRLKYMSQKCS